jgi:hypothetical protein
MLFPPDEPVVAGRLLAELIEDPERRHTYGRRLRERQRTVFSLPLQVAATLEVLEKATRR